MPALPEIRTSFYLLIVPADGIGTADKEGAETSVRRRFLGSTIMQLGS